MDTRTWIAATGTPVAVTVSLGDNAAGAFAIDVRDEHLNKVNPIATDSNQSHRTWLLPPLHGPYRCLVTLNRYAEAQVYVRATQDQVLPCYEHLDQGPINGPDGGPFQSVEQGPRADGLASFHLVVRAF